VPGKKMRINRNEKKKGEEVGDDKMPAYL